MKKIIMVLLSMTLLVACSKTTRTDVIDVLLDNGYLRNKAYYYEKLEDNYMIRIGYLSSITGYLESLKNFIDPGVVVLIDIGNNNSFNYHFNQDAMLYNMYCIKDNKMVASELMYSFKNDEFIVGNDYCEYDNSKDEELKKEFINRKEIVLSIIEEMGLTKKKLDLLGSLKK